jgi:uncharacterized repeat protein (TIGR02543 family)
MPFTLNGTTLTAVSFNGTNITTVIFNGTTVFSSMTVTFNANGGGTPSPTSKVVINGSTYGTLATVSRTGHTFNGWFTASSGGTQITSESTVTQTANHTLFAQWTAITMTVTFNANGGTTPSPTSKVVTYNSTYGTLATTSRSGFTFNGWFTASSGGVQRTSSSTVTATANHTLFAQWTEVASTQTSTPFIGSMACSCDFDGTAIIVTVTNNDSSSATVYAASNTSFSGQQSATVSSGGSATFYFYGYFNPPGSVTFYARAQASGKTMSSPYQRTQSLTFCFSEPGCGGGGGFGGF